MGELGKEVEEEIYKVQVKVRLINNSNINL